jgi:hypothetical protein
LVHPQGWEKTDILVESGDHLSFKAEGSVNIDLAGIIENVQHRLRLEDEITRPLPEQRRGQGEELPAAPF